MSSTLIVIPARMEASRLPGKPLADIAGLPMIVHVWRRAMAAEVGSVVVATDADAIAAAVRKAGGEAVMTRADHASGSDRVFEAVNKVDPEGDQELIVNLQGDLPTLEPRLVRACLAPLSNKAVHLATLAAEITDAGERTNPNIGVYAFRRASLERFAALPSSPLEKRESLEQLRALEAGMRIDAAVLDKAAPSVDTERDLTALRAVARTPK